MTFSDGVTISFHVPTWFLVAWIVFVAALFLSMWMGSR